MSRRSPGPVKWGAGGQAGVRGDVSDGDDRDDAMPPAAALGQTWAEREGWGGSDGKGMPRDTRTLPIGRRVSTVSRTVEMRNKSKSEF